MDQRGRAGVESENSLEKQAQAIIWKSTGESLVGAINLWGNYSPRKKCRRPPVLCVMPDGFRLGDGPGWKFAASAAMFVNRPASTAAIANAFRKHTLIRHLRCRRARSYGSTIR